MYWKNDVIDTINSLIATAIVPITVFQHEMNVNLENNYFTNVVLGSLDISLI